MSKRDAIQILLDLEQKVEILTKNANNNDMLLKALLNVFNLKNPVVEQKPLNPNSIKIEAALPEQIPINKDLSARSHKRVEHTFDRQQLKADVKPPPPPVPESKSMMFNEVDIHQKVMLPR